MDKRTVKNIDRNADNNADSIMDTNAGKKLYVVLPAYNEEENVEIMVKGWLHYKERIFDKFRLGMEIVIVNDGSSDRTKEIGEKMEKDFPECRLINHSVNKGLGEALKTGLFYAKEKADCACVCVMDCDNTQKPKYIGRMLYGMYKSGKAPDVVIASRYCRGSEVFGVAGHRLLTSQGARFVYQLILGVPGVRGYTCGYRLYKREALLAAGELYGEGLIEESGFTCMAELLYKLYRSGASFMEVPFSLHYEDKKGSSKMKVIKTALNSIILAFNLRLSL